MICNKCGHELVDNSAYCSKCGHKLNDTIVETSETNNVKVDPVQGGLSIVQLIIAIIVVIMGVSGLLATCS